MPRLERASWTPPRGATTIRDVATPAEPTGNDAGGAGRQSHRAGDLSSVAQHRRCLSRLGAGERPEPTPSA